MKMQTHHEGTKSTKEEEQRGRKSSKKYARPLPFLLCVLRVFVVNKQDWIRFKMDASIEKFPTALRAVVFDLDGVLANTEDLYEQACVAVLGRRGLTYDPPLRERMMGRPVADAL